MAIFYWFDQVDHPLIFLFAALLAAPAILMIWKMVFDGWDDFLDCLKAWQLPLWLSFIRGEAENIHVKVLSIALFALLSLIVMLAFYRALLAIAGIPHSGP